MLLKENPMTIKIPFAEHVDIRFVVQLLFARFSVNIFHFTDVSKIR